MDMKAEITGVTRIEVEQGRTAALISCDKETARQRVYHAFNTSDVDADTTIVLHPRFGGARIEWIADEPGGLRCGPWVIYVGCQHDGVVVMKQDGYYEDEIEAIDMENEWIDVLVIVRNFFAIAQSETWDWEKFI